MENIFKFADELGPAKIIHIYLPSTGLKAIVVVDNIACGPSIGGVRIAPDVTVEEAFRLARAMTLKNAAAGLPHGGGKSVILGDPEGMSEDHKEKLIRAFACTIKEIADYIPGPDMGTDEHCMAWIKEETGRAVGLPSEKGGIPLDEIGATGYGLSVCAEIAKDFCDLSLSGAKVVVQGFGSVGMNVALFLEEKGALLIGAADLKGTVIDPKGLNVDHLIELVKTGKSIVEYPFGEKMDREAVVDIECDIWIPAARPDVINEENVNRLKTKLILQGANIPITIEAEKILQNNGVIVVPDIIANVGGVICCAVEYRGGTQTEAFQVIKDTISGNTKTVLEEAAKTGTAPRQIAINLAKQRIETAAAKQRWS